MYNPGTYVTVVPSVARRQPPPVLRVLSYTVDATKRIPEHTMTLHNAVESFRATRHGNVWRTEHDCVWSFKASTEDEIARFLAKEGKARDAEVQLVRAADEARQKLAGVDWSGVPDATVREAWEYVARVLSEAPSHV